MTTPDLIAAVDEIRDTLAEARRYLRSRPDLADGMLDGACERMFDIRSGVESRETSVRPIREPAVLMRRLVRNLIVAMNCMRAAPDVAEAYITAALWELGSFASDLRADLGRAARDAELAEAYGTKGDAP